jgi:tight adherence protein C
MSLVVVLIVDVFVFAFVALCVVAVERQVTAGLTIQRRVRGETVSDTRPGAAKLVRTQGIRNPFLAWVQASSLNDPKERQKLSRDLIQAGFYSTSAQAWYVVIRFGLALGLPAAFLFDQQFVEHPVTGLRLIIYPLVLAAVGLIIPRAFIDNRANARRSELENEFPDALDLLVVCVEAGLGLEAAFVRVGEDTAESHKRISEEFRQVSQELRAGRSRGEALNAMADRTQVDIVKSFVALLIQTDALGVSIAQSLRTYSQEMRNHRMIRAEEKAMRIPVLLTIPLVACILPVIVGAVLLPPVISAMRDYVPALTQSATQAAAHVAPGR